ncbi:MAG: 30S ribosomal protein S8 [Candidatus Moranbacteria bacterium]|nr:30S ribosomal protein S8 [Candidatus Moranbacteria bacterium]
MLDPIADMLTRIRNAQRAGHREVVMPSSKLKLSIARILEKENFIEKVETETEGVFENIRIGLKYIKVSQTRKDPAIREIKRVSHEGQRIYVKKEDIKKVKNGYGIAVVSTSKGVMTGRDAYRQGLGGEYLCEVW